MICIFNHTISYVSSQTPSVKITYVFNANEAISIGDEIDTIQSKPGQGHEAPKKYGTSHG